MAEKMLLNNVKILLSKKEQISNLLKFKKTHFILKPQFSSPVELYLNNNIYIPRLGNELYSNDCMFFASIPHKKQFDLIKQQPPEYEVEMVDGIFRLYLTFLEKDKSKVKVRLELALEDTEYEITMKTQDLFDQFNQMWIDLVDCLYQVYPKELVDQEMNKIYKQIDESVANGQTWI